ncbi:peptidase s8 : Intracellular alkaline serine proteinase OS=Burkholderia glathei GN=BG61_07640 PE=4 SV=1: Peptidase_S8 [Gemmata massiliana]|uniref:Peptidase S8/S53 domain-containing protein n=1 Tax=Gemmata massiliana TaxID=1210884 RepID=A0A6P2DGR3_9BACT|nr:S8 family serine peptidase [Gemmata massiliana]VTS00794.1 peptidase s8 : Intracellular alkaline serine proteinase OS=Burkholderia glathei GN=BG61_07640 PE=4 SV=1: Peptidase_S8 [Gemmata massiliana]
MGKKKTEKPSDIVRVAVTFKSLTKYAARMTTDVVDQFKPDPVDVYRAVTELERRGFTVTGRGGLTVSVRGARADFERTFGTKLVERKAVDHGAIPQARSFFAPPDEAAWSPDPAVSSLIDDAYIQWPHLYFNQRFPTGMPSPIPPRVTYHHLRVPSDVAMTLNAARVHRRGTTGRGVRVVMIDSGFAHAQHPYFDEMGYNHSVVLAPGATHSDRDGNGHGTGESANVFAVAPDVTFIGVKLDNEDDPSQGASVLEGFQEAMLHHPQIISVSLGYDLVMPPGRTHMSALPNSLKGLEAEIQAAVAAGVVVVFSAGNGHVSFPGMMPEVISAGGVHVDENGAMEASDYASAFGSAIYAGRNVPDFCGLVGMQPRAQYIMLPLGPKCEIDRSMATGSQKDETKPDDGWATFSGTSAAAPQLAGVCALLLEKNPALTPAEVKAILRRTTRDVVNGAANAASNNGVALSAGPGADNATGAGLVDAFEAWLQA